MINLSEIKQQFQKTLDNFQKELQSLRTGEASIELVEDILADYYGIPTPIKQIASISVPESRTILISPWDKSSIPAIEKAIQQASHLGLNPISESGGVRLVIPIPTEERRLQLVKELYHKAEEFKTTLRQMRDEQRSKIKTQLRQKEISEDQQYQDFEQIDNLTKEYQTQLDDIAKKKEKNIMTI